MNDNISHEDRNNAYKKLVLGFIALLGKAGTLVLNGKKHKLSDLLALVEACVAGYLGTTQARAAYAKAVATERAAAAAAKKPLAALRQAAMTMYGTEPEVLATLGLEPRKAPRALTIAETTDKVERALATRKARHTMGKKQKRKVTGATAPEAASAPSIASASDDPPAKPAPSPVTAPAAGASSANGAAPPNGSS